MRIIDDIAVGADGDHRLGRLAAFVRDTRVPLEMCPSSNVHVGAAASIAEHPIGLLAPPALPRHREHGQPADERDHASADEFMHLGETFGWDLDDVRWATINAMKSAFLPFDQRLRSSTGIKPGYASLRASVL